MAAASAAEAVIVRGMPSPMAARIEINKACLIKLVNCVKRKPKSAMIGNGIAHDCTQPNSGGVTQMNFCAKFAGLLCIYGLLGLTLSWPGDVCAAPDVNGGASSPATQELRLGAEFIKFDPRSDDDLQRLTKSVSDALSTQKRQVKGSSPALEAAAKKYKRALQEIEQLSKAACNASTPLQRSNDTALLLEVVMGVNNDQRQPVPERVDVWQLPGLLLEALHHPVGRGNSPATDLAPGPSVPLDCRDPLPYTFWKRPDDISAEDLYHGFGRTNLSGIEERICSYYGPKDSYGTNPGFEVECEGERVKLKFAELSSEPFTTRIYDALGFHADVTDFAPSVRVHYDRRIL